MNFHIQGVLLACVILFSPIPFQCLKANAQENNSDVVVVNDDENPVHGAIRNLRDGLLDAISEKNVDAILTHLHEDVVLTMQDGSSLSSVRKHAGVRDYMDRLLTGDSPGVKNLQLDVNVDELTILHGSDAGIAFGSSADHYLLSSGGEFDLKTRWSATVVADGDQWKVASLHVSSNLFDNPVINATKRYLLPVGVIVLGVGLLIGFVIARLLSKGGSK